MMSTRRYRPSELIAELGIESPEDLDLEAIAQHCGATVVYETLTGCEARIVGARDRAFITVNICSSRERQRFSIGHELGHWMNDRGRLAISCTDRDLEPAAVSAERAANVFAVNVLMPERMFQSYARAKPVNFDTARELGETFQTSLQASALRLVEVGPPSALICSSAAGRQWFRVSTCLPRRLRVRTDLGRDTIAIDIHQGRPYPGGPVEVPAKEWFDGAGERPHYVLEHSIRYGPEKVLSLLWWNDESPLLLLNEDE